MTARLPCHVNKTTTRQTNHVEIYRWWIYSDGNKRNRKRKCHRQFMKTKKSRDKCVKSVVLQLMSIWYGLVLLLIRSYVCVKEVGIMCSVKSLSTSRSSWKTLQSREEPKRCSKRSQRIWLKKICLRNQSRSSCCWRGYPSVGGGKKGHSFVLLLLFLFVVETVQGHLLSVLKILLMLSCWEKGLSVIITAGFSYEENNRILSYNSQVF